MLPLGNAESPKLAKFAVKLPETELRVARVSPPLKPGSCWIRADDSDVPVTNLQRPFSLSVEAISLTVSCLAVSLVNSSLAEESYEPYG